MHHGYFGHALTALKRAPTFDVGPLPLRQAAATSTPMNASFRFNDFRVVLSAFDYAW